MIYIQYHNLVRKGVIKSVVGEITDHTNSADAFAMLHVPWAIGTSFGYVKCLFSEIELFHNGSSPNPQCTSRRLACQAS